MPIVDVHTHVYPPSYISLLSSRTTNPRIRAPNELLILPGEEHGRPVGPEYSNIQLKIDFMDQHGIDISIISLANPWLDFVDSDVAASAATSHNDEMNDLCDQHPGRLFAFGTLPLSAADVGDIVKEVERLPSLKYMRGIILGTSGLGSGLDDARLHPIYKALEQTGQTIFLHPHYGLPKEVFGPRAGEYGHVLPLALGFPLETTIAVSRMILSGVFDRFPKLSVLLAHSGGTLPFLAGRLESCIVHDGHLFEKSGNVEGTRRRDVWEILKTNILLDAVVYSEVGVRAAVEVAGADRVLFGTSFGFLPLLMEMIDDECG